MDLMLECWLKHLVKHYIYLKAEECTIFSAIKKKTQRIRLAAFVFPAPLPSISLSLARLKHTAPPNIWQKSGFQESFISPPTINASFSILLL